MKARPLILVAIAVSLGCEARSPTAPTKPTAPGQASKIIRDGAHGGNPDFFFLPPMVPLPINNPAFQLGTFNNTLQSSLRIEICELNSDFLTTAGLPTDGTTCGPIKKAFPKGSVNLVNLPLRQSGWWTAFNLPADGFYYVLWDTRTSNLDVSKYYRIKVFVDGRTDPLGVADVDPMANLFQWKFSLTGEVIQLVDDVMLPIPFRVEQGAICYQVPSCGSFTVTNDNPNGDSQIVTVNGTGGAIAGAEFPDGWLPAGGPQSVTVTITQVPSPETDAVSHARTIPCHVGLPFLQFNGCFTFTTTPTLARDPSGNEFAKPVRIAVCYILQDSGNPLEQFGELYSSGPNEPPHALDDATDVGLLDPNSRNCSSGPVIGMAPSNPVLQYASAGWRGLRRGLGKLFGVKTAYAVDLGLGGFTTAFSSAGVVVPANAVLLTPSVQKLAYGEIRNALVHVTGATSHASTAGHPQAGMPTIPVTFTLSAAGGGLGPPNSDGTAPQMTVLTDTLPGFAGSGWAMVAWTQPSAPGVYKLTATAPALGSPITITDTVRGARTNLSMQTGSSYQIPAIAPFVSDWTSSNPQKVSITTGGLVTAIVGSENVNGGDAVTLNSTNAGVEAHTGLVNSFAMDIWPRTTTLVWLPVQGAVSYDVIVEYGTGCGFPGMPANCTTWQIHDSLIASTNSLTFRWVGAQPARWHVTARDATGTALSVTPFLYFGYII